MKDPNNTELIVMRIQDIYERYNIPPILQSHMYSVAGLGSYVADTLDGVHENIDKDLIVQALLVHDMGNIVKFDLSKPLFIPEHELDYWRGVQNEFIEKYGRDDHEATTQIVKELGVADTITALLSSMADTTTALATLKKDINFAIMFYADFRVGPRGILSLDERIDDLLMRYQGRNDHFWSSKDNTEMMRSVMKDQEAMLQSYTKIPISTITDVDVAPILKTLSSYPIDLNQES